MKGLQHHKTIGFSHNTIHTLREPHALYYLKQRTSFWIASLSLFTFLIGNMMGHHGWYAFWASVLGEEDLSAIAYVGTVSPLENVVDYGCWAEFGGDYKVHTFRQAPAQCLRPMPQYTAAADRDDVFSMQYMSSYSATTEGTGDHAGVDIRVPVGTPVRAVMTGRVERAGNQSRGFGEFVVLLHPNVPDPARPSRSTTTLYSEYAHLSTLFVQEGDIVHKGDIIALSGNTGNTTGPHLHFAVTTDEAPYHPYYPSSKADGYAYTVSPLAYTQSDFSPVGPSPVLVARADTVEVRPSIAPERPSSVIARLQSRRDERLQERLAQRERRQTVVLATGLTSTPVLPAAPVREVASEQTVRESSAGTVTTVAIAHDGRFSGRGWEKVTITLLDADGNTVTAPRLNTDLVLRTEFGTAEFRPATLSPLDFTRGVATVNVLPRGNRTVVIKVMPYNVISAPMQYER